MEEQCLGITKAGARCKIKTNLVHGYCRIHQNQAPKNKNEQMPDNSSGEKAGESRPEKVRVQYHSPHNPERSETVSAHEKGLQNTSENPQTPVPPEEKIEKHAAAETPKGEREIKDSQDVVPGRPCSPDNFMKLLISGVLITIIVLLSALTRKR